MMYLNSRLPMLLFLGLLFPLVAKATYNPLFFQNGATGTTLAEVKTNNANAGTLTFILFGDGTFGTGEGNSITRQHRYPSGSTSYTSKAFFVEKYKPDPPTARTATVTTGAGSSVFINPTIAMPSATKISASWFPTPSGMYMTILSFKNTCSNSKVSGTIKYYFNETEQTFTTGGNDLLIYNNWITSPVITVSDDPNFEYKLEANYSNLSANEMRHIYIQSTVKSSVMVGTFIQSKLVLTAGDCANSVAYGSFEAKTYPHDPNAKTVDKESVCAQNTTPHTLKYTISFHNDGETFAQNVFVSDILESQLIGSSAQMLSSSDPCNFIVNAPVVDCSFINIMLPGANQTFPHIYTYDETFGSVTFRVGTVNCLPIGNIIKNSANVVFNALPPIVTTKAVTVVDDLICAVSCDEFAHKLSDNRSAESSWMEMSPNPVSDKLQLRLAPNGDWNLQVFNAQGQCFFSTSGVKQPDDYQLITVDVQAWPDGIYFVQWKDAYSHPAGRLLKM